MTTPPPLPGTVYRLDYVLSTLPAAPEALPVIGCLVNAQVVLYSEDPTWRQQGLSPEAVRGALTRAREGRRERNQGRRDAPITAYAYVIDGTIVNFDLQIEGQGFLDSAASYVVFRASEEIFAEVRGPLADAPELIEALLRAFGGQRRYTILERHPLSPESP